MTTGVVPVLPKFRFTTPAGIPYSGGSLTIYLAGTTTLATTYLDSTLSTPGPNPITLDTNGECTVWATPGQTYKWLLKDANSATVSGWPVDNISVSSNASDVAAAALVLSPISSDITAVSAIAANVTAVAGNAANINTVAGISANVTSLAPQAANIGTTATNIGSVNTVATNIGAVNQALTASATAGVYPNAAASNVPKGLTQASVGAITAGSGGTNGSFALGFSAGTGWLVYPTGTFTVAGGAVTAVTITGPGLCISGSAAVPTVSFSASAGLTGAAVALTLQFLVTAGQGYWAQSADGLTLDRYNNVAGVATRDTSIASIPFGSVKIGTTGSLVDVQDFAGTTMEVMLGDGTKVSRLRPTALDAPAAMTIGGKSLSRNMQDDVQTQIRLRQSTFLDRAMSLGEAGYAVNTTIMSNALDGTTYTQVRLGTAAMCTDNQTLVFFGTGARTTTNDFGVGDITIKRYTYNKTTRALTPIGSMSVFANGDTDPDGNANWGLPQSSVGAITGGSGGTNGTFSLAWSGGNFSINPVGTFTVSGGALTAVTLTNPGLYAGNTPSAPTPSFAASAGLTGASVVLTPALIGGRYLTPCLTVLHTGPNRGRLVVVYLHRNTTGTVHRVLTKTSDDKGATWSAITEISSQLPLTTGNQGWNLYAPGPSTGIQLRNGPFAGRVVIPGWHGTPDYPNGAGSNELYPYIFRSALIYSDNVQTGGTTWSIGVRAPMEEINGSNECSIAEDWAGDIVWNLREVDLTTHGMFKVKNGGTELSSDFYTFQDGNGADITAYKTSSGMVQVAGIDPYASSAPKVLVTYPNDSALLQNLTVSASYDGGLTFPKSYLVTSSAKNSVPISLDSKTIGVFWEDGGFSSTNCTVINLTNLIG